MPGSGAILFRLQEITPFSSLPLGIKLGSRNDLQRCNLVPFELEKISKVNGAAGKVSNQMAGNNRRSVLLFACERLACVFIFCRGIRLPLFDGSPAFVGVPLILHDGILSETL